MKHKLTKYLKEALLFIVVMTIFANILSFYRSSDLNKEPLNLKEVTLLGNTIYKVPQNEPILIHFWASWCPTCKVEAQNIERISKSFNVLTIALKSGSDEEIEEYLKSRELTFKTVNDGNGEITGRY
ncbi:MAG TPA: redoxin family protein, partial [Sulfurimonas sp.]